MREIRPTKHRHEALPTARNVALAVRWCEKAGCLCVIFVFETLPPPSAGVLHRDYLREGKNELHVNCMYTMPTFA